MRSLTRLGIASLLAFAASAAYADTITGSVYSTAAYPSSLSPSQTPTGHDYGSFTVNQINFYGGPSDNSPSYTVGGFLSSNGSVPTLSSGLAGLSLNDKELQLMGNVYLTAGTSYSITHDDGVFLYLDGSSTCTVCSGSPTSAETSQFTVGTSGTYSFDLLYAEVNGAPGVLDFPATTATPAPSSFILLGSGLMTVAGLVRRRVSAR